MVYIPQGKIAVFPETLVERWDPIHVLIDEALCGDMLYGRLHLRENRADLFAGWLEAAPIVEYVPARESIGIMVPTEGVEHEANIAGITLAYSEIELNMRDVGKFVSLHENFKHHLVNYIRSEEGQALAVHLAKLGYKADDIDYIAIGFVPDEAIYGVGRLPNGEVVIYANKDSYKKLEREAEGFGMDIDDVRELSLGEEITHIFRDSKPSIPEERETKSMLMEFYETLANKTSDSRLKAKYEGMIRHLKKDIETIARYANSGYSLEVLVDMYNNDSGDLVEALEAEAIDEGIEEDQVEDYVNARLSEVAKAAEDSDDSSEESGESSDGE